MNARVAQIKQDHPASWGFAVILGIGIYAIALIQLLRSEPLLGMVMIALLLLVALVKKPAIIAGLLLVVASMAPGSPLVILAAPLIVLLAIRYRDRGSSAYAPDGATRSARLRTYLKPRHPGKPLAALALAAALSMLFAFLVTNFQGSPQNQNQNQNPTLARAERGNAPSMPEWLGRIVRAIFGSGETPSGENVAAPATTPTGPPSADWWQAALLLTAIVILIAIIVVMLGRIQRRLVKAGPRSAPAVERLEQIGESIGRPRRSFEGPTAYADGLANHAADPRIEQIGPLLTEQLYNPSADVTRDLDSQLGVIESNPPAPPQPPDPPSRKQRIADSLRVLTRWVRDRKEPIIAALAMIALLGAVAISVARQDDAAAMAGADGLVERDPFEQTSTKPSFAIDVERALAEDPNTDAWTTCMISGYSDYSSTYRENFTYKVSGGNSSYRSEFDSTDADSDYGSYSLTSESEGTAFSSSSSDSVLTWTIFPASDDFGAYVPEQPDLSELARLPKVSTTETVVDQTTVRRHVVPANWYETTGDISFLPETVYYDIPWTLEEYIDPDGSVNQARVIATEDEWTSWWQIRLDADSSRCPKTIAEAIE